MQKLRRATIDNGGLISRQVMSGKADFVHGIS